MPTTKSSVSNVGCAAMLLCAWGCGPSEIPEYRKPPVPPLTGVIHVGGTVTNSLLHPLSGVHVEVLDGQAAGESATTDASGNFALIGVFAERDTIHIAKEGYAPRTVNFGSSLSTTSLSLILQTLARPVDLRGDYTMTIVADGAACAALPEEARTRTYQAAMTNIGVVTGGTFHANELWTFIAGNDVLFQTEFDGIPMLVERLAPDTYLAFHLSTLVSIDPPLSSIDVPFNGWIEYCRQPGAMEPGYRCSDPKPTRCTSPNHRLILTRQ